MSDWDAQDGQNMGLLRALLWAGVGLAPVAALLVLVGGEGPTRFGVLLVAVSVVLLGATMLVRSDPVLLRMDVEDRVADEVNALRAELRGEIAAAASVARAPAAPVREPGRTPVREHGRTSVREPGRTPVREPGQTSARQPGHMPAREPGQTTGGRAAVVPVRPEPGTRTGGRAAAVRPVPTGPSGGRASVPPSQPDPGAGWTDSPYPPSFDDEAVPAHDAPAYRVPSAPGWPEARPPAGGRAPAAPVPGQRARAAAVVPPPAMVPVFRPPAPAPPRTYGSQPVADQGGRRRADVTAIDLGYTGRRAKPDHDSGGHESHGYGDQSHSDQGYGDQGYADQGYSDQGYGDHDRELQGWTGFEEPYRADDPLDGRYGRRDRDRAGGW